MSCTRRFVSCLEATVKSPAAALGVALVLGVFAANPAPAQVPLPDATCPNNLVSCTANDVKTRVVAASTLIEGDTCTGPEDTIGLQFTLEFETTANERYDLGFFVSKDGGTVQEPSTALLCAGAAPQKGDGVLNAFPDADPDLFLDLDPHGGADTCGDLRKTAGPVRWIVQAEVACTVDVNGDLTVPSCRVWEQNANHPGACTNLSSAGTGSKCDCTDLNFRDVLDPCVTAFCDDGEFCNGVETCDSTSGDAVCIAGDPVICDDGVDCTVDTCNEVTDSCDFLPDNSFCDNGLFCDGTEVCDPALDCQPGTPVDCDDGVACTVDTCNEGTDSCDNTPDNAFCDNGLFCDGTEVCDPNLDCQDGPDPNCDDGVSCTVDTCNEETDTCDNGPDDSLCDNGLFCDGEEVCDPNLDCQDGADPNCDDGVSCTVDTCNEDTDTCDNGPDDSLCDNGLFCDGEEVCDPNLDCQKGADPNCNDGVTCTVDTCNEDTDTCDNGPDDSLCDNGLFCDGEEVCDPNLDCQDGPDPNCDDGVSCTVDTCNEDTDTCDNGPDDSLCDNGLFCDGEEVCDPTQDCQAGTPVDCDDGVTCTVDACNEDTDTCDNGPDDSLCDNGLFCDGEEVCDPAQDCQAGTPVDCDDGVDCTVDACNDDTDSCDNDPDDAFCDNGLFCDGEEVCDPAQDCQAGTPVDCDDGVSCTVDTCNEDTDSCDNGPDDTFCDDGIDCTIDSCDPVNDCVNDPDDSFCDDTNVCTDDICDPFTGCLNPPVPEPTQVVCDDGDPCTSADGIPGTTDVCGVTGECVGVPVDCEDGDICTTDVCDAMTGICESDFDPTNDPTCVDAICRTAGFWGARGSNESGGFNYTQAVLGAVGCLEVCGVNVCGTDETSPSYGIGNLGSALEAVCVTGGGGANQPYRQLVTAALNCVLSGDPTCNFLNPLLALEGNSWESCNLACETGADAYRLNTCSRQLDCFNNGGQWHVGYGCSLGTCADGTVCGGDFGGCLDFSICEPLANSCHARGLCESPLAGNALDPYLVGMFDPFSMTCVGEALGPASSSALCQDARKNRCTISTPEHCDMPNPCDFLMSCNLP